MVKIVDVSHHFVDGALGKTSLPHGRHQAFETRATLLIMRGAALLE